MAEQGTHDTVAWGQGPGRQAEELRNERKYSVHALGEGPVTVFVIRMLSADERSAISDQGVNVKRNRREVDVETNASKVNELTVKYGVVDIYQVPRDAVDPDTGAVDLDADGVKQVKGWTPAQVVADLPPNHLDDLTASIEEFTEVPESTFQGF